MSGGGGTRTRRGWFCVRFPMPTDPRPRPSGPLGGLIHTYQKYDPKRFPSPTAPPPDVASAAMEHMLMFGGMREFTDEDLANAIKLDVSQIAGLGPSLEAMIRMLEERRKKILETYDPAPAVKEARERFAGEAQGLRPPKALREAFEKAVRDEQLRDLERLWYRAEREDKGFAAQLLRAMESLGNVYETEELGARWTFTGREPLDVDSALEVKEELETIERLLEQLREAMKNAQLAYIDMDELREFVQDAQVDELREFGRRIEEYLRSEAERQGLERDAEGNYRMTPRAMRLFQGRVLQEVFNALDPGKSGRHEGPVSSEGAVEVAKTRPYEFGDSPTHMDVANSVVNAVARMGAEGTAGRGRIAMRPEDIDIHLTRNNAKCATVVAMDMSGSMRHGGQYINAKRMALALEGLIRTDFPGDFLRFVEVFSLARLVPLGDVARLMPKPVTIYDPVVRLRADMSDPNVTDSMIPPHFTNIQRGLQLARQLLAPQDTPNKQVFLITDGLPTAHFEADPRSGRTHLYLLYPPDPLTERATMREAMLCKREGITINIFLLPSWNQSSEDVAFAHRMAEQTGGRVFFTAGRDLDRFVLWDYVNQRRKVIG